MAYDAGRLRDGFSHLRVCMAAFIVLLGLKFSDVPWVNRLSQQDLTMPKPYDIVAAFQWYDLRRTKRFQQADAAKLLLELQSFCFRVADIADEMLGDCAHVEVLGYSAALLPVWITERWKSEHRKKAEAAAWPVVKRWSDIASRDKDCQDLFEEGGALLERAERILGPAKKLEPSVPRCERITWTQRMIQVMRRTK